jgi:hypothetical protein
VVTDRIHFLDHANDGSRAGQTGQSPRRRHFWLS